MLATSISQAIIQNCLLGMLVFFMLKIIVSNFKINSTNKFIIYITTLIGLTAMFIASIIWAWSVFKFSTTFNVAIVSKKYQFPYQNFISNAYLIGLGMFIVNQFTAYIKLTKIKIVKPIKTPIALQLFLVQQIAYFGITKKTVIIVSHKFDTIFTIGHLKPIIYFPLQYILSLNQTQCQALITHELAHIKRHDYLWNIVIICCKAILFFNPIAWWLQKQLQHERELDCDNWVKTFYFNPMQYAETLMALRHVKPTSNFAMGFASTTNGLTHRIKSILNTQKAYFAKVHKASWVVVAASLILFLITTPNKIDSDNNNASKYNNIEIKNNLGQLQNINKVKINTVIAKNRVSLNTKKQNNKADTNLSALTTLTASRPNAAYLKTTEPTLLPAINVANVNNATLKNSKTTAQNIIDEGNANYLKANYNNTLAKINNIFQNLNNNNAKQKSIEADSILKAEFLNKQFTLSLFAANKKPSLKNFGKAITILQNTTSADSAFIVAYNSLQVVYNNIKNATNNLPSQNNKLFYYNVKEANGLCLVKFNANIVTNTISPQMYFYHLPTKKLYLMFYNSNKAFVLIPLKNEEI